MSYCLNPDCQKPQNPDGTQLCQSCGSKLLLKGRYRAIQPISSGWRGTFLAVDESQPDKPPCTIKQFCPQELGTCDKNPAVGGTWWVAALRQDAQRLASLEKPLHLPQLLAHFVQRDCYYWVEEFIRGQNLVQELAETGPFNEAQIVTLLEDLLPVVQFLHSHNLIHGNIKPANIIRRSPPYQGKDQVVLVGLGGAAMATPTSATNTPSANTIYMAPERSSGQPIFASDLYSLGVTCIYLLTQIHPLELFDNRKDVWVWHDYVRYPIAPSRRQIIEKLVERVPFKRYESAEEVLQALRGDFRPAPQGKSQKAKGKRKAENIAVLPATSSDLPSSPVLSVAPLPQNWQCVHIFRNHFAGNEVVAISPDGLIGASSSGGYQVDVWDLTKGELLYTIGGDILKLGLIGFTPDGKTLVAKGYEQTIELWHPQTGQRVRSLPTEYGIGIAAISPDGQTLVHSAGQAGLRIWDLHTGKLLRTLSPHKGSDWHGATACLAISPDGQFAATCSELWHLGSGHLLYTFSDYAGIAQAVAFSPDGETLAVSSYRITRILHPLTGKVLRTFTGHIGSIWAMAYHPSGQILATGAKDGRIKLWDPNAGKLLQTLSGHPPIASALAFSADGQTLISGGQDGKVKVWRCA